MSSNFRQRQMAAAVRLDVLEERVKYAFTRANLPLPDPIAIRNLVQLIDGIQERAYEKGELTIQNGMKALLGVNGHGL